MLFAIKPDSSFSLHSKAITRTCSIKTLLLNFAIFTGKHLYWNLFLVRLQACNFIEKRLQHRCFPVNIANGCFCASALKESPRRCILYKRCSLSSAKLTGEHLCCSLFCNKVADLQPTTLLKKRLLHRCFLVSFVKFLTTPFLWGPYKRLLVSN